MLSSTAEARSRTSASIRVWTSALAAMTISIPSPYSNAVA
jgi:hypothetical protein